MAGASGKNRARRSYHPTVEGLEALRLLSLLIDSAQVRPLTADHEVAGNAAAFSPSHVEERQGVSPAAWDMALGQTQLSDILPNYSPQPEPGHTLATESDPEASALGLSQLNRYLARAWYRSGIPPQLHEDCSQAVYATLLQQLGRDAFDKLLAEIGHAGIKDVLGRGTEEGLSFFRAVDMVKKRSQRERTFQSLEFVDVPTRDVDARYMALSHALHEAIDQSLNPREARLIHDTLMGKTPAEIALTWGVAPKTISNEKARVLSKLREVLTTQQAF